ncbi:TipAS antibiotic-recognition domain-containing protein [Herbiconiux moechotypicola]|uniref:TipAS antibiotic-recognition domain-containing protein n=1 Tax=Herbiconiux moechotypicola TaxID=637393 RepID=A0ABN3DLD8_9MICO|nr:TipAS antibiotic-recognition domain-containing protein [Herbiconiux moechotypicola]MCS5730126.1 TipAS antibiotic-recognition domain-containing protein [Herbiconiux moechotypicola]
MTNATPGEWSIQEVARLAGTTSRTLRHYDSLGLVRPARVGANGYRYYDEAALLRLQRVLLLRELGLGLPAVAEVLGHATTETDALRSHLGWLDSERSRLDRQIASVRSTLTSLERKEALMAETMFDGFDHTRHREEVEQRWGADAYAAGDAWWSSQSDEQKAQWQGALSALNADWQDAAERGLDPAGAEAQALAARHHDWLAGIPGVPRSASGALAADYLTGLGELYLTDERFAANYGGLDGARFVRDALAHFALSLE